MFNWFLVIIFFSWKGDVIGSCGGWYIKVFFLDEMFDYFKNVFFVIEDKWFYNYGGVDLWGIVWVLFVNVIWGGVV